MLDFSSPRDNVYAFAKLYGTLGERPVFPAFQGTMFAVVGSDRPRPLFGYAGFSCIRSTLLDSGHVLFSGKELGVFTDLATGGVLETWQNPWTNARVEVFNLVNPRIQLELTFDMPRFQLDATSESLMNDTSGRPVPGRVPFILPWSVTGDMAMLTWEYLHHYPNPLPPASWREESATDQQFINPSEHFTFFASMNELSDRSAPSARYGAGFFRQGPFWPWMKMGQSGIRGVLFSRAHSYKALDTEDNIPEKVRRFAERAYPGSFEPPQGFAPSARILSTWEAYRDARRTAARNPIEEP